MNRIKLRALGLAIAVGVGSFAMVGCTTTGENAEASGPMARSAMERNVDETLNRLYIAAPGSRELVQRAAGVLVFPSVAAGSFVIGAQYGKGVLREGGRTVGYYSLGGGSIGLQVGGQSKAVVYVFNSRDAMANFKKDNGWSAGAGGTIAAGKVGANGSIDTATANNPITSFVLTNTGLEAGAALGATKISPITL